MQDAALRKVKAASRVSQPEANLHGRHVAEAQFPPHQDPEHDAERVAVQLYRVFARMIRALKMKALCLWEK